MALEQGTRVCLLVSQCTINSPWSPGNRPLCVKHPHSLCSLFLINSLLSEILCLEILFQPPHTPCHHMLQPRASAAKKKKKKVFFKEKKKLKRDQISPVLLLCFCLHLWSVKCEDGSRTSGSKRSYLQESKRHVPGN